MKRISAILAIAAIAFLPSCNNSGEEKKDDKMASDTTAVVAPPAPAEPVFTPFKIIVIQHSVKNYAKWEPEYQAHDSMRQVYGITKYVIGRGLEDSNKVIVIDKVSDVAKAKEFGASASLKDAMKKAGVVGAPTVSFVNVVRNDDAKIDAKDRVIIMHKVKDYDTWLKAYDAEGKATRAANGLVDRGLGRNVDDSNMISIVFAITDMAKAKARMNSPELKKIMTDAGVVGAPQVFFYRRVDNN